jgi:DNA-binding Lrp family transcriptional regulator
MAAERGAVTLDEIDRGLLRLLLKTPRDGVREYARVLGIARGTAQSRLSRLVRQGVIRDFAPDLDPVALGYPVLAFVHLHIAQGRLGSIGESLATLPEVLEAHSITGDSDVFCRVVARDHPHLETIVQQLLGLPGVVRTRTEIALHERVGRRVLPIVEATQPTTDQD